MHFEDMKSLEPIVTIVNEAAKALNDENRISGSKKVPIAAVPALYVLGAPLMAAAAGAAYLAGKVNKDEELNKEKGRLFLEVVKRRRTIMQVLEKEGNMESERCEYLQGLNILLRKAMRELQEDLGIELAQ